MSIAQYEKALSGLTRAIRQLGSKKETTDRERRDILKKAQNAAQLVLIDDLISEIQTELNDVEQKIEESLKQRREQLLIAARDSGTPHKRFTDYDRVGIFKVTYKGQKIQLDIGSEILMTIEETNGDKAFDAINKAAQELESTPFSRDEFFATIKSAFGYARADGNIREGRIVPVPVHLRDSHYGGAKEFGHGEGYVYSHNEADGVAEQDYLGIDRLYYDPADRGFESELRTRLQAIRKKLGRGSTANESTS